MFAGYLIAGFSSASIRLPRSASCWLREGVGCCCKLFSYAASEKFSRAARCCTAVGSALNQLSPGCWAAAAVANAAKATSAYTFSRVDPSIDRLLARAREDQAAYRRRRCDLYAKMTYCVKGGIRFSRLKRNNPVACW